MNIFAINPDPGVSARMLADRHVVKMCLETAQIVSTIAGGPYRPTHSRHPSVLWAASSPEALSWTVRHGLALGEEYTHRYSRTHKSIAALEQAVELLGGFASLSTADPAEYRYVGPDEHARDPSPYVSYLRAKYGAWKRPPRWTNRAIPLQFADLFPCGTNEVA